MFLRWLIAIFFLPGVMLVVVPLGILWLSTRLGHPIKPVDPANASFWVSMALALAGFVLCSWSMSLFFRFGNGTPTPWTPPTNLVIRGPYQYVRNPMLIAFAWLLAAEALYFRSWLIVVWAGVLLTGYLFYLPRVEEPALTTRFGEDYSRYRQHVRRWIPRLTPWPVRGDLRSRRDRREEKPVLSRAAI